MNAQYANEGVWSQSCGGGRGYLQNGISEGGACGQFELSSAVTPPSLPQPGIIT